jgi:beta-lactamase class A
MIRRALTVRFLLVACVLLLFGNIAWFINARTDRPNAADATAADHAERYPLLSGIVLSGAPNNDILINFVPLRKSLEQRFATIEAKKSFYFEYVPDGTSIRIGADEQLVAASLIKVPLAMNLYRAAELGRIDLDKKVTVTPQEIDDAFGDLWKKGPGFEMTLRQAARYMLIDSDNTATHVVFDHVKNLLSYDEQSFARLDIDQNTENGQAVITARSYSSVLKGLYFSAYLNNEGSQELLGYLSKSKATNRLTKYLPDSVPVAHKIGVYNANWAESDCGIVYVPKRPYILCVMVGLPESEADEFIAQVSKEVYGFVTKQ